MRFILLMFAVFALGTGVLTACQDAAPPIKIETARTANTTNSAPKTDEHGHADDAPRINIADAKKDFDAGNVVFIDTRAASAYKTEHVKGAINLSVEGFEAGYKQVPTGKKIIAYCS
ncbi:MAG TPA: rhodanese-like domain-containing protein [Pyrinomonadaceae bacterium]|nr:rhodanese-like domain-containing protein [Pyrinomonadaceae bacterium]